MAAPDADRGAAPEDATPAEALQAAAADGVEFDGLAAAETDEGYRLSVPDHSYTGLSAAEFAEAADRHEQYVRNWLFWHRDAPKDPAAWAFLRWVERAEDRPVPERRDRLADGVTREWGQLSVRVRADEGAHRVYDLRHVADADASAEELTAHTDPHETRRLRKTDDDGGYRPLSTAPTLATGWAFPDLGPAEVVRAVQGFYPATVENWYRERTGELDVTHWHDAVSRQTGIYGVVQTWDRGEGHEHVNWVAESYCEDSQCLKRRKWEYDEETELDVDGGDGEFPCREPCSLVVATARTWTRTEAEQSRTYEFELTPTEKEQVEAIIDAVADGRAEEIREGDTGDPANRYRARFLRAKRFDEAGNLCGVPTEPDESEGTD